LYTGQQSATIKAKAIASQIWHSFLYSIVEIAEAAKLSTGRSLANSTLNLHSAFFLANVRLLNTVALFAFFTIQ